jgi:phosphatidylglycerophosphate synthase
MQYPAFVALLSVNTPLMQVLAALSFAIASLTDWMDGWYGPPARQETDFGRLMTRWRISSL